MIVVDTSALMTIALREGSASDCLGIFRSEDRILISAGTLAETLIVSGQRGFAQRMFDLVDQFPIDVVPLTVEGAKRAAEAYSRWGKGVHPAKLNFGDCFAYELAASLGCRLLFVGDDFRKTDVVAAL